jgi:nucleotide-binding universal stress UspA family protein
MTQQSAPIATPNRTDPGAVFENVLCGVDGSPSALEAVIQAAVLAGPGAHLDLICVQHALGEGRHAQANISDWRADEALTEARDAIRDLGVSWTRSIVSSPVPATKLLELLDGQLVTCPDLVAVGPHVRRRLGGIMLGSTGSTLLHRAPVPVLVARRAKEQDKWAPRTLLVASDGSPCASAAVDLAARIAARHGSAVAMVCAGHAADGSDLRHVLAEQAATLCRALGTEPAVLRLPGEAHREIPRLADELSASLILLGCRGTTGLRALGSVSERVAHSAHCSVLVARGRPS